MSRISKDRIGALTADAAFFITVSFVPFIMLLIGMVRFLPVGEEKLLSQVVSVLPNAAKDTVTALVTESYENSGTLLVSVSAIVTLWAASIGIFSLIQGLNRVFCATETRNFIIVRVVSMFYTLLVMTLFIVCLAVFVFGDNITAWVVSLVPWLFKFKLLIKILKLVVGLLVLSLVFLGMFLVVPNRKAKIITQIPGAVISGIGWTAISYIFSIYIESAADYSYLYGSLSIIVFFMLWLFACIYALYIGAEVNKYLEDMRESMGD